MEPKKAKEWIEVLREGLSLIPKTAPKKNPKKNPRTPPTKIFTKRKMHCCHWNNLNAQT